MRASRDGGTGYAWRVCAAVALLLMAAAAASASESAEQNCLAVTLYWEAGTEGRRGMLGVGWVVLNRTRHEKFPRTVCAVVKQRVASHGCQFSYWCDGKADTPKQDEKWMLAQDVARDLLSSPPPDPTGGALFFHTVDTSAPWEREHKRTTRIGRHVYYR